jgi:hypothetical protein
MIPIEFGRAKVENFDIFLEVFLTKPAQEVKEIMTHYETKYGSNLVKDIVHMHAHRWRGNKGAESAIMEILRDRLNPEHPKREDFVVIKNCNWLIFMNRRAYDEHF